MTAIAEPRTRIMQSPRIRSHKEFGRVIVVLPAEMRRDHADGLEMLFNKWTAKGEYDFIVDARNVDYMTSGGIGALARGLLNLQKDGGSFWIRNLNDKMKDLFRLTQMDKLFTTR